jgi:hypothetical protein
MPKESKNPKLLRFVGRIGPISTTRITTNPRIERVIDKSGEVFAKERSSQGKTGADDCDMHFRHPVNIRQKSRFTGHRLSLWTYHQIP